MTIIASASEPKGRVITVTMSEREASVLRELVGLAIDVHTSPTAARFVDAIGDLGVDVADDVYLTYNEESDLFDIEGDNE